MSSALHRNAWRAAAKGVYAAADGHDHVARASSAPKAAAPHTQTICCQMTGDDKK